MQFQLKSWIARVPSASNPADAPSRLDNSELKHLRATKASIPWKVVSHTCRFLSNSFHLVCGRRGFYNSFIITNTLLLLAASVFLPYEISDNFLGNKNN